MRRFVHLFALVTVLLSSTVLGVSAQEASPAAGESLLAGLGLPEIAVTSDGTGSDFPEEVAAGRYYITLENTSALDIDLEFFQLPDGFTIDDYVALAEEANNSEEWVPPDVFYEIVFNGGVTTGAGETAGAVVDLTPGEWYANVFAFDPEGEASSDVPKAVTVTGEMPALEDPAGIVQISMAEMYFEVPDTMTSGPQVWRVENTGEQVHHVVLWGVPDGTTSEQVLTLLTSMGPPASPAAGASNSATPAEPALGFEDLQDLFGTPLFSSGQFGHYEVDLAPGTYVMVCFLPDPTGMPHFLMGMVEVFTVE